MKDLCTESVVAKKSMPGAQLLFGTLVFLAAISLISAGAHLLFLVFAALFGFLAFKVWSNTDVEYEYIHTNNIFDIDKVMHSSRRKSLLSLDLNQVVVIAHVDSDELAPHLRLEKLDYSGNSDEENKYGIVCVVRGKKKLVLIHMEPKMLKSLKMQIPSKVFKA